MFNYLLSHMVCWQILEHSCLPVVVDVSEPDTIGLAPTWKQDVQNHAEFTVAENTSSKSIMASSIPVLLLGNKADKSEVLCEK